MNKLLTHLLQHKQRYNLKYIADRIGFANPNLHAALMQGKPFPDKYIIPLTRVLAETGLILDGFWIEPAADSPTVMGKRICSPIWLQDDDTNRAIIDVLIFDQHDYIKWLNSPPTDLYFLETPDEPGIVQVGADDVNLDD